MYGYDLVSEPLYCLHEGSYFPFVVRRGRINKISVSVGVRKDYKCNTPERQFDSAVILYPHMCTDRLKDRCTHTHVCVFIHSKCVYLKDSFTDLPQTSKRALQAKALATNSHNFTRFLTPTQRERSDFHKLSFDLPTCTAAHGHTYIQANKQINVFSACQIFCF